LTWPSFTSGMGTLSYLRSFWPWKRKAFMVGAMLGSQLRYSAREGKVDTMSYKNGVTPYSIGQYCCAAHESQARKMSSIAKKPLSS
jgi:hypothetical protein